MTRNSRVKLDVLIFSFFIVLVASLAGCQGDTDNQYNKQKSKDNQYNWQKTVDRVSALHAAHKQRPTIKRHPKDIKPGEFLDVNKYFKILTHLRMSLNYDLDYVYAKGGLGSEPILYARKTSEQRLKSLKDLANFSGRHIRWPHKYFDYLEKVVVKGTLAGYFELVVLRIMGGQFYLVWHCQYNDKIIICDRDKLPGLWKTIKDLDPMGEDEVPLDVREQAYDLDFTPRVKVQGDKVVVQVVVFTKWGGFFRESYYISIAFPHKIQSIDKKKLVHYDWGVCY